MIWFDLDNSPHVPLFRPVFAELDKKNVKYTVTSRNFAQTTDLLKFWKIPYTGIGAHAGKSKVKKVTNLLGRSLKLRKYIKPLPVNLAVSHGSRAQLVACKLLGIKSILMLDYEYTETKIFNTLSTILLMPECIPGERLKSAGFDIKKIIRYRGIKEELYLKDFIPDKNFRKDIDVNEDDILVVVRPPGMSSNYHDSRSEPLLVESLKHFSSQNNAVCLIINRTQRERDYILSHIQIKPNIRFLEKPVDGLQLLYAADIAVSGGGTMNRESAMLGTKTYSIFTGKTPYIDEWLEEQGKLKMVRNVNEIANFEIKRIEKNSSQSYSTRAIDDVLNVLLENSN
ncbi:MAG: DUF354 domain-containing protein [Ignavibacteriae bacterium]|nr:MAG: DUF354 domain-containing protein [Ignavibacteriota bacterium]